MAEFVNQKLQDANYLKETTLKYKSEMAAVGVTDELMADFESRIQSVVEKDSEHREAGNLIHLKTAEQNDAIRQSKAILRKIKTAVKDAFYGNNGIFQEFHIGMSVNTVKAMLSELPYFKELTTRHLEKLSGSGIGEADIAEIERCHTLVADIDSEQENAKRTRSTAYSERKEALKHLQEIMYRIRKKADICFADDADKRNEFRTIIVRKKKSSATGNPPDKGE